MRARQSRIARARAQSHAGERGEEEGVRGKRVSKKTVDVPDRVQDLAEYQKLFGPSAHSRQSSGAWILQTSVTDGFLPIAAPNSSVARLQLELKSRESSPSPLNAQSTNRAFGSQPRYFQLARLMISFRLLAEQLCSSSGAR
eukprot:5208808-Pyramimonas_sp.AAC.1